MSNVHQHFQELSDQIDRSIGHIVQLFPDEVSEIRREVSRFCERVLSSWTVAVLPPQSDTISGIASLSETATASVSGELELPAISEDALVDRIVVDQNDSDVLGEATLPSSIPLSPKAQCHPHKQLSAVFESSKPLNITDEKIQPLAILSELQDRLAQKERSWAPLLVRLFFAIGSPESLLQLRDACRFIRQTPLTSRPVCSGTSELASAIQALDSLEDAGNVTSILRRYHLARLLTFRNARFQHHLSQLRHVRVTRFKHDHVRVRHAQPNQGQTRAATAALKELLAEAYPHLHDEKGEPLSRSSAAHQRAHSSLKRRISNARNWLALSDTFSVGILSLVPTGGELAIHNHQVETIPAGAFQTFLAVLSSHRGAYLRMAASLLSKGIFDTLRGKHLDQLWYPLENYTDEVCRGEQFDSFAFVVGCTSRAGENPRITDPRFLRGDKVFNADDAERYRDPDTNV